MSLTLQISLQESKSARHEAAADLQRSCEEAFHLQQQMFDLRQGVLEPLQAEHAAMLAALDAVRRLCAELALSASAQPADPAHLMAPAVHHAAESASPHSSADAPSHSLEAVTHESATAAEAAEAAERAVRDSLERAQHATAALADAKRLAEVLLRFLFATRGMHCWVLPSCNASVLSTYILLWACPRWYSATVQTACMALAFTEKGAPKRRTIMIEDLRGR